MLYLHTDVLLLADVLESFRNMSLEYYDLDANNFMSIEECQAACSTKTKSESKSSLSTFFNWFNWF